MGWTKHLLYIIPTFFFHASLTSGNRSLGLLARVTAVSFCVSSISAYSFFKLSMCVSMALPNLILWDTFATLVFNLLGAKRHQYISHNPNTCGYQSEYIFQLRCRLFRCVGCHGPQLVLRNVIWKHHWITTCLKKNHGNIHSSLSAVQNWSTVVKLFPGDFDKSGQQRKWAWVLLDGREHQPAGKRNAIVEITCS